MILLFSCPLREPVISNGPLPVNVAMVLSEFNVYPVPAESKDMVVEDWTPENKNRQIRRSIYFDFIFYIFFQLDHC